MSRFFSKRFDTLTPYVPGEQPQDMQYIKLNTNESPYPPSPKVIDVINGAEAEKLRLYSDPESRLLIKAVAEFYGIKEGNIIAGNGSDEILAFCFTAFFDAGNEVVFPDISYGFYPVYAKLFGLKVNTIPLKADFDIDLEAFISDKRHVIIANPNAPTGICRPLNDIESLVKSNANRLVIVDEAYIDFGGESCVKLIEKYENLIVVQTFSKSRSLAGGRLGFAVANEALINDLKTIKYSFNPYNVNRLTAAAGTEAVKDREYFELCRGKIIAAREFTVSGLKEMGFEVLPSEANFIFARSEAISGESMYLKLKAAGILVRYFKQERIKDFIRISIGTEEQMQRFLVETEKLGKILAE